MMLFRINVQMDGKLLDWNFKFGRFSDSWSENIVLPKLKLAVGGPKKKNITLFVCTYGTYLPYGILLVCSLLSHHVGTILAALQKNLTLIAKMLALVVLSVVMVVCVCVTKFQFMGEFQLAERILRLPTAAGW